VETTIHALLASADATQERKVRPSDVQKLLKALKLRKASVLRGIPDECFRHLPGRPLVYLTHLFNRCLRLTDFQKPWKEEKVATSRKPCEAPKFPQDLRPISFLFTTGKQLQKVILQTVGRHAQCKPF
jgi:hypothetical protein